MRGRPVSSGRADAKHPYGAPATHWHHDTVQMQNRLNGKKLIALLGIFQHEFFDVYTKLKSIINFFHSET